MHTILSLGLDSYYSGLGVSFNEQYLYEFEQNFVSSMMYSDMRGTASSLLGDQFSDYHIENDISVAVFGHRVGIDEVAVGTVIGLIIFKLYKYQHFFAFYKENMSDAVINIPADPGLVQLDQMSKLTLGYYLRLELVREYLKQGAHNRAPG